MLNCGGGIGRKKRQTWLGWPTISLSLDMTTKKQVSSFSESEREREREGVRHTHTQRERQFMLWFMQAAQLGAAIA